MATYPVVHKETGEQKEVKMSVMDWTKWCEDNNMKFQIITEDHLDIRYK